MSFAFNFKPIYTVKENKWWYSTFSVAVTEISAVSMFFERNVCSVLTIHVSDLQM